ncbi:unnamed protein product [Pylaiella littoralis]
MDEVPWVKAMGACLEPAYVENFQPTECQITYTLLAHERGNNQLLPALHNLWWQQQRQRQQQQEVGASQGQQSSSSMPSSSPSAETIANLLSLLQRDDIRTGSNGARAYQDKVGSTAAYDAPLLRILTPSVAARVDGGILPFFADVHLGAALERRLLTVKEDGHGIGSSDRNRNGELNEARQPPLPPFHRCELHVVVDGSVASRIPLDEDGDVVSFANSTTTTTTTTANPATTEDRDQQTLPPSASSNGGDKSSAKTTPPPLSPTTTTTTTTTTTMAHYTVRKGVIPDYYSTPRCSEHPLKAEVLAAAGEGAGTAGSAAGWRKDEDAWRIEAREVDRVCTRDAFGAHRLHAELSCCHHGGGGTAFPGTSGHGSSSEVCEIVAQSAPVEYLHTGLSVSDAGYPKHGHVVNILSDSWAAVDRGGSGSDFGSGTGSDSESGSAFGSGSLLLDPPPEDISVSVYVERAAENTIVVSVPRWISDGEVWEEAFHSCFEAFGPVQGFLIDNADCVDLIVTAISEKRADLYNRVVVRLDAYLRSMHPHLSNFVEGHTGNSPEKVEALGAMPRDGGDRVSKICEVGFNAGHSSLNWLLSSHPSVRVLAFDLGEHDYV